MEKMIRKYKLNDFSASIPYLDCDSVFLDIETLGFSAKACPIYLIGMANLCDEEIIITLLFADSYNDESDVIKETLDMLKSYKRIITFNGEAFDIPFILTRAEKYSLDSQSLNSLESLDLLKHVRGLKKLLGLVKCNQKTVEAFLGIKRDDKYSGGDLIAVYKEYINDHSKENKDLLILHNFDDVKGMVYLLPILAYKKIPTMEFSVDSIDAFSDDGYLIARGSLSFSLPKPIRLSDEDYYIILEEDKIKIALRSAQTTLKYYYPYPGKYVYLIKEGMVIPKTLATSIPQNEKRPARADECFTQAQGYFIGIKNKLIKKNPAVFSDEKLFCYDYKDDTSYIKTDPQAVNPEWIKQLASLYISQYV